MEQIVNLTIDNKSVQVPQGTSILRAAASVGVKIPTLCYYELKGQNIENRPGACRVCVVEIEGRRNLAPACATDVMEGIVVHTHSLRVVNARRTIVELMLSDHPASCLTCAKSGKWTHTSHII